jgi:dipeptide/tripeptide permease
LRTDVDAERDAGLTDGSSSPAPAARRAPWAIAWELFREKAFWRFMLFVGLLALVRLVFQHYHFTWPKYVLRTMGESFPLGRFSSMNPILIIFGVPVVAALTRHRSALGCIIVGSFVTAASLLVLCLPASYPTIIVSIVLFAAGEALWSPRLFEYAATVAPRGREASYMGLSSMPYFLAKMAAGPMSGYLLAAYCPEHGPGRPWIMWLIIGLVTLLGPVLIVVFRGVIEGKPAARRR